MRKYILLPLTMLLLVISSQAQTNSTKIGFITKIDQNGEIQWTQSFSGDNDVLPVGVRVDSNNNICVTTYFNESIYGDSFSYSNSGNGYCDLSFNSDGTFKTGKVLDSTEAGFNYAFTTNSEKVTVHTFKSTVNTAGTQLSSVGGKDILVQKYSEGDIPDWAVSVGSVLDDEAYASAIIGTDIYVVGYTLPEPNNLFASGKLSVNQNVILSGVSIMPKPANAELTIKNTNYQTDPIQSIEIRTLDGKIVLTISDQSPKSDRSVIDISGLPAAVYLVTVSKERSAFTDRIVIAR